MLELHYPMIQFLIISYISLLLKKIVNGRDLTNADRLLNRKKACFQPFNFLLENIRAETTKVYVNVSDSAQLNKNLTFV